MKFIRSFFTLILVALVVYIIVYLALNPETTARFFNGVLMMGMPVLLGVYLARKFKVEWRLFGIGALTFIGAQVLHIPFNEWALKPMIEIFGLEATPGSRDLLLIGLIFGLSAGVFEESARYIVYRRWLPKERSWKTGLMFGAGHGGIEAIIFGAIVFYVFLQAVVLRGSSPESLEALVGAERVPAIQEFLNTYWTIPWYEALLGALERASTIVIQISATILVLQSFRRDNPLWFYLAVLWHTVIDALAVYAVPTWGIYPTEGIILLFAVLGAGIIVTLRSEDEEDIESLLEGEQIPAPPQLPARDESISAEQLEDSRYD